MKQVITLIAVGVLTVAVWISCRKIDYQHDRQSSHAPASRFFNVPATASPTVKRIAAAMKKYNDHHDFVTALSKKNGFPAWDKAPVVLPKSLTGRGNDGGRDEDTLAFIPLVADGKDQVTSFLAATASADSIKVKIFNGNEYAYYGTQGGIHNRDSLNALTVASMHMKLESLVFPDHDTFELMDPKLYYDSIHPTDTAISVTYPSSSIGGRNNGAAKSSIMIFETETYCIDIVIIFPCRAFKQTASGKTNDCPPDRRETVCYEAHYWNSVVNEDYGLAITNDGSGVGYLTQVINCDNNPLACGGVPHMGWYASEFNSLYDPYQADSVKVKSSIKDVFPCIYSLIRDSLDNLNRLAQFAGANMFNDSVNIHLVFDTSTTNTHPDSSGGVTYTTGHPFIGSNGATSAILKIDLNPWHLRNATHEYIISTIIHEVMHAVFTVRWAQYQSWLQYHDTPFDSTWLKSKFPIYWSALPTTENVTLNELQEHEIMAADYLHKYDSIMRFYFNPSATTAQRDTALAALGYCGLHATTAWKRLPLHGVDTCKYKAIQLSAQRCSIGDGYPTGCVGYGYNYHYLNDLHLRPSCN